MSKLRSQHLLGVFIAALCYLHLHHHGFYAEAQSTTVRPYKFGFTIDQQQHRYEKRDERGIVMGEFGFITADGIYHVTVYATDEEGRFRILAMKNYPYESKPTMFEIMMKPKAAPTTTTPKTTLPRQNFYNEACSGCFLSNGNNKKPKNPGDIRTLSKDLATTGAASPRSNFSPSTAGAASPKSNFSPSTASATSPKSSFSPSTAVQPKSSVVSPIAANQPGQRPASGNRPSDSNPQVTLNSATPQTKTPTIQPNVMDAIVNKVLPSVIGLKGVVAKPTTATSPSGRSPVNSLIPNGKSGSTSPAYGKANTNPQYKPSAAAGGAGGDDGDLYRFKYILDYHGHTETGKRNGNKEGNYFAIGDDDIERNIEYVANENGYQPRIHWRKLNNPVPAKENNLKDYEFVWFTLK